jgi:fumarate reductase iron-sulfur subunit
VPRTLHIRILRHNPHDPDSVPRLQSFELEEADTMTLFIALNEIRQTQDPSCNSIRVAPVSAAAAA